MGRCFRTSTPKAYIRGCSRLAVVTGLRMALSSSGFRVRSDALARDLYVSGSRSIPIQRGRAASDRAVVPVPKKGRAQRAPASCKASRIR
jgi:hypothetical protein